MATTRSQHKLRTPKKDESASESDHDYDSDSENQSLLSQASGSISYCGESPGSASFEVRNRSNLSSPGSRSTGSPSESLIETPKSKVSAHPCSPLAHPQYRADINQRVRSSPRQSPRPQSPRTPRSPRKRNDTECEEYHVDLTFIIAVAVIVGLAIAGVAAFFLNFSDKPTHNVGTQTPNRREVARGAFSLGAKKMTAAFPSQTSNFWATINAAVKSIMDPKMEPLQPAVIMVTCRDETCPLANCIASHLAKVVTEAYASEAPLDLNVTKDLLTLRAEDAKLRIDEDFRKNFQSGSRAAILRNLHDLQGGAAMILHGFCDNENAPFKEAVLIFTLELTSISTINTAIGLNNAIEKTLDKSWGKDLDTDNLSALYSRLGNSPVHVKSESREVFQKQCLV